MPFHRFCLLEDLLLILLILLYITLLIHKLFTIAKLLNGNCFWVVKLPLTASGCYNTNFRLLSSLNNNSTHVSWKYWVMRGYGKMKTARVKFGASTGENWLTDIDLLLYSELFWSVIFPHSDWIRRDTEWRYFLPNEAKYGSE